MNLCPKCARDDIYFVIIDYILQDNLRVKSLLCVYVFLLVQYIYYFWTENKRMKDKMIVSFFLPLLCLT